MPVLKRWHPVSHDFAHDPEVLELRAIADWLGYGWLELLSIADRNDGEIKGSDRELATYMARSARGLRLDLNLSRALVGLDWMLSHGWIRRSVTAESPAIKVVNYAKYHRHREPKENPHGNNRTPYRTEPSEPSEPNSLRDPDRVISLTAELHGQLARLITVDKEKFIRIPRLLAALQIDHSDSCVFSIAEQLEKRRATIRDAYAYVLRCAKRCRCAAGGNGAAR